VQTAGRARPTALAASQTTQVKAALHSAKIILTFAFSSACGSNNKKYVQIILSFVQKKGKKITK
jgi:hypothetical protein